MWLPLIKNEVIRVCGRLNFYIVVLLYTDSFKYQYSFNHAELKKINFNNASRAISPQARHSMRRIVLTLQ